MEHMAPSFDIDPASARPWMHIPCDWRRPAVRQGHDILWDKARGFGQVWPRPAPYEVPGFYALPDYYTHGEADPASTRPGLVQRLLTRLSWMADKGIEADAAWWARALGPSPRRVLEIGCGHGANLALLASMGHQVTGLEPDPQARRAARQRGLGVHDGTAEALPLALARRNDAAEGYDAVIFLHVLEHCLDPAEAMRNAVSLLRPGGKIIAEVPNNDCLGARHFGPFWFWLDVPRHLNFFTRQSLTDLFRASGLRILDRCWHGYCRQFAPEWQQAHRRIAHSFGRRNERRVLMASYWAYLARSFAARPERKYDSLRLIGIRD